jgi:hypothetical protein
MCPVSFQLFTLAEGFLDSSQVALMVHGEIDHPINQRWVPNKASIRISLNITAKH